MSQKDFPNWVRVLVFLGVIALALFSIKRQNKERDALELRGRYTIGKTAGWVHNHRSSDYALDYVYSVRGRKYKAFCMRHSLTGIVTKGGEYLVIFDPENPKVSKILLDKRVISHIQNFKDTGWVKVPDFVDTLP